MTRFSPAQEDLLRDCETLKVHAPGAIQPQGCLLALSRDVQAVRLVSANLEEYLGASPDQALGTSPVALLGHKLLEEIQESLCLPHRPRAIMTRWRRGEGDYRDLRITPYLSGEYVVLEFEPIPEHLDRWLLTAITDWQSTLHDYACQEDLLEALVERVRQLSGYERVLIYCFDDDWNGQVVTEFCQPGDLASLLHHHFPAGDIPPQVRHLYATQPVRVFPNAPATAVALLAADAQAAADSLDLSPGYLRAIAPVHQAYLANMGVRSALSVGLLTNGTLWGLLACHSPSPKTLSPALRDTLNAMVQAAAQRLCQFDVAEEALLIEKVNDSRKLLSQDRGLLFSPMDLIQRQGAQWLTLFDACGLALVWDEQLTSLGETPSIAVLQEIRRWLDDRVPALPSWQSHSLRHSELGCLAFPADVAGLLAAPLPLASTSSGWLLLFRVEQREQRVWAGEQDQLLKRHEGQLGPRRSFGSWQEEVRDHAKPWRAVEVRSLIDLAEDLAVLASSHEIAQLNAQLHRLATRDHLTGVWNRYYIEHELGIALSVFQRYHTECAVLLFDIDHFKQVNDTHGHEAGDRVLAAVAQAIEVSLRDADRLGRWGGEEFIVLVPHASLEQAEPLAERLRRLVASLRLDGIESITISIGVTVMETGDDVHSLVARADEAMYRAKLGGRNRIAIGTRS